MGGLGSLYLYQQVAGLEAQKMLMASLLFA
jgi:hypothetical protein